MKIIKLNEENELEKRAKYHRKRQKGMSPFSSLNPNAGDVEKGCEFFNHAVSGSGFSSDGSSGASGSMGEGFDSELEEKQKLFEKIKAINPNAKYDNYKNISIEKMIAIYNSYKKSTNKKSKKSAEQSKPDKIPTEHDVYYDRYSDSYRIPGFRQEFVSDAEAYEFIRELRK